MLIFKKYIYIQLGRRLFNSMNFIGAFFFFVLYIIFFFFFLVYFSFFFFYRYVPYINKKKMERYILLYFTLFFFL